MKRTEYLILIETLKNKYSIEYKKLNPFMYDFTDGDIPLFQLLYGKHEDARDDKILVSMHLDLDPMEAIQWYLQIKDIYKEIYLTSSFYKDDQGETFLGQLAYAIREHKETQRIVSGWQKDTEETKKFLESKITGRDKTKLPLAYIDQDSAVEEFHTLQKEDKDKCH